MVVPDILRIIVDVASVSDKAQTFLAPAGRGFIIEVGYPSGLYTRCAGDIAVEMSSLCLLNTPRKPWSFECTDLSTKSSHRTAMLDLSQNESFTLGIYDSAINQQFLSNSDLGFTHFSLSVVFEALQWNEEVTPPSLPLSYPLSPLEH
jgi:hypothetical protein